MDFSDLCGQTDDFTINGLSVFARSKPRANKHNNPNQTAGKDVVNLSVLQSRTHTHTHTLQILPTGESLRKRANHSWIYQVLVCVLPRNQKLLLYFHNDGYSVLNVEENRMNLQISIRHNTIKTLIIHHPTSPQLLNYFFFLFLFVNSALFSE